MVAAIAGAVLTALPPAVAAGLDAGGYRVGEVRLEPRGQGVYAGPAGALVLVQEAGEARAGASTHVNGEHMVGGCRMRGGARSERCWFQVGGRILSAEDWLQNGGWERRYNDGARIRIELLGGRPVPVPFAVGR
jgi:hypothetical protein